MYEPPLIDLVFGSAPLRRRQATARVLAHGLARVQVHGLQNIPPGVGLRQPNGVRP